MTIEKLDGTSARLYALVAPLVMRRSVLRQNNGYPFPTSRAHSWFVATEEGVVQGFVPVEITSGGIAKIDNYYAAGDDAELLAALVEAVVNEYRNDYALRSVTHMRHAEVFRSAGFRPVRELKSYVKMEYRKPEDHECL